MNQEQSPVVLVVEDDWLLRLLAVEVVEDAGLVAVEAANADEEEVEAIAAHMPPMLRELLPRKYLH